ncbi:MAG: helix-turn-helix transcriptional regulator [Alphaproteobacteria bacterium]|nr:helix-turn-helix transcriptional regulator [Alphaproteobacteria bacterium]
MTPSQCRAARGLLNWSQPELARRCSMHKQTISNFEAERSTPSNTSLEKISRVLENGGVEFGPDNAVSLPQIKIIKLEDRGWFITLLDDVIFTLQDQTDPELLIYGGDNRVYPEATVEKLRDVRKAGIRMREMVCEGNTYLMGQETDYRWIPKKFFKNYNTIVYGDRVCVDFRGRAAILIINKGWADAERVKFEMLWDTGLPVRTKSTSDIRY